MEYYRTFNFNREPFSNSPDPVLFYSSRQHLEALQQLEIAIRLKRGLNLITGEVGTGKTTLCRQLIQKINFDPGIEYHLILDADFKSSSDFLNTILKFFTGTHFLGCDDNHLKEEIKNYLFSKGVDENKITVLLIDEGQKLPDFCLEILRELLNYETNSQKLLQIVIFAQKELEKVIEPLENFVDRINFRYDLHPLNFKETKGLINFRINASFPEGYRATIFTYTAFFVIYSLTRGYPRKIINLCHHVLLALIVQNKSKAGFFFIRSCAMKAGNPRRPVIGLLPASVAAVMLLISIFFFNFPDISGIRSLVSSPPAKQTVLPIASPETSPAAQPEAPLKDEAPDALPKDKNSGPALVHLSPQHKKAQPLLPRELPLEKGTQPTGLGFSPQKASTPAPTPADQKALTSDHKAPPQVKVLKPNHPDRTNIGRADIGRTDMNRLEPANRTEHAIIPDIYGTILVPRNETLSKITEHVYGTFNKEKLEALKKRNEQLKNPNQLEEGMPLVFPVLPNILNEWQPDDFCIVLSKKHNFRDAYAEARRLENRNYTVRLLPVLNHLDQTFSYHIVINRPYPNAPAAQRFINEHVEIDKAYSVRISAIANNLIASKGI